MFMHYVKHGFKKTDAAKGRVKYIDPAFAMFALSSYICTRGPMDFLHQIKPTAWRTDVAFTSVHTHWLGKQGFNRAVRFVKNK